MDCQQDLAINTLTVLDECNDSSILCHGNAIFKNSIKVFNNLHIYNDIRTCGNIIPLKHTTSLGSVDNMWMDLFVTDGTFNKINVDELNVKQLNVINACNQNNMNNLNDTCKSKYIVLDNLDKHYDQFKISYKYDNDNSQLSIDVILCKTNIKYMVFDLTNLNSDVISNYCDEKSESQNNIDDILCVNNKNITFYISLPDIGNKIKIIIINPENYNITFNKNNAKLTNNIYNNSYQSYKFLFLNEINNWLLIYKI